MHATIDYTPEKKEAMSKPGPGAYDGNMSATKRREPGWKLGTGKRGEFGSASKFTTAPGAYDPNF